MDMQDILKKNKILIVIFILVSIIHVIYASLSQRAAYLDGALYITSLLENFSYNNYTIFNDPNHTRGVISFINQIPMAVGYFFMFIKNKYILSVLFSLPCFLFPLLGLWWNYLLTKRTGRYDIFVLSFFTYATTVLLFQISAIVELSTSSMLCFVLMNYLAGDIDYNKKDIALISILVIMLFGSYENILFIGPILFFASLYYAVQTDNQFKQKVKFWIGQGGLYAAVYVLLFILTHHETQGESIRFFKEFYDFLGLSLQLNTLISIIAIVLLVIFAKRQELLSNKMLLGIGALFSYVLFFMSKNLQTYLQPMWEYHTRTIPCWLVPLLLLAVLLIDILKKKPSKVLLTNTLSIILFCGIAQTMWQINNTFWWNKNIDYMKKELKEYNGRLYIPEEHEEIASFFNKNLRRYIWHFSFASTSIVFSNDYEVKTLLSHYDKEDEVGNKKCRDWLFVENESTFYLPTARLSRKNKFWDVTKATEALDKYNKAHNIKTFKDLEKEQKKN